MYRPDVVILMAFKCYLIYLQIEDGMKLLKTQYEDIMRALEQHAISKEAVFFVKKRGRISIKVNHFDSTFEFFKRKSVSLNEMHQWEKSECYELNVGGNSMTVARWEDVLSRLNSWLIEKA